MSLKAKAQETLKILEDGGFKSPQGEWIDLSDQLNKAVLGTRTYLPEQFVELTQLSKQKGLFPTIEVTAETTQIAAARLVEEECDDLVLLNYASARNPGGGFINGAKAQEEDLNRCSGLYQCLRSQMVYYQANREHSSMLYTDHVIYSPRVPWFRVRSRDVANCLFLASVISAPAVNATQARRRGNTEIEIKQAMHRRCGQVLGVARANNHRTLLLGAWGCGVFGNNPRMVANIFHQWLTGNIFQGAFDRVVFAVYDRSKQQKVYQAFCDQFTYQLPN